MVERRICARRNQPEANFVGQIHDFDACHGSQLYATARFSRPVAGRAHR
jgi:hypothetical protein